MIITKKEIYRFTCSVIGPRSTIRIFTKPESTVSDYGYAIRDNGQSFDIEYLSDFLALAAVRGCEIKAY